MSNSGPEKTSKITADKVFLKKTLTAVSVLTLLVLLGGALFQRYLPPEHISAFDVGALGTDIDALLSKNPEGPVFFEGTGVYEFDFKGGFQNLLEGVSLKTRPEKLKVPYSYSLKLPSYEQGATQLTQRDTSFLLVLPPVQIASLKINWKTVSLVPALDPDDQATVIDSTKEELAGLIGESILNESRSAEAVKKKLSSALSSFLVQGSGKLESFLSNNKVEISFDDDASAASVE